MWCCSMWACPGYQVARRMREEARVSSVTIIALSGFGEKEATRATTVRGASGNLS
jgi:hypothetical protein